LNFNKPLLGITMGDPAGIGPEVVVKALTGKHIYELCRPLVIGDGNVMAAAAGFLKAKCQIHLIDDVDEANFEYGTIDVLDLKNVDLKKLQYGQVSAMAGDAAFTAIEKAISLAMEHRIDATVTAPINKEAINLAGHHFSGHTEIYAHYTGTRDYAMMLVHEKFRVIHVSTHVSLRQACERVKQDRVFRVIMLADEACKKMGISTPKIGVAGLNPHAGENGLFGVEETQEIIPAIEKAQSMGVHVEGPIPPDSLFPKLRGGWYDIAVAMYHDQGHIPIKVVGFIWNPSKNAWENVSGINITLGLPIIRSSVDHGTAFDLVGKGVASESSMVQAIEYGAKMAGPEK
jgi:4-hydroxythreonine-4-phosphate dehydrogenase